MIVAMDKDCEHLVGQVQSNYGWNTINGSVADKLKGAKIDRFRYCPRCGKSLASFWIQRGR